MEANSKSIAESMKRLQAQRASVTAELDQKQTELTLQARSLAAREESLNARERKLDVIRIQLKDQRETLERAFIRMAQKPKKA